MMATSFGGLIALRFAQAWPDRLHRMVLMDVVGLGTDLPWPVRLAALPLLSRIAATTSRPGTTLLFRRLLTTDRTRITPEHQDALVEYIYRSSKATDPRTMAESFRAFAGLGGQREVLSDDELAALRQPILLVWGELDRFLPRSHAERAARLAPRAELRLIPGAGHSPNWEAPDAVLEVVRPFLEAGRPQGSTP
jgi:pimeloyl-ACP methyl ester carboxylesterase